jgi:hypothetical protein
VALEARQIPMLIDRDFDEIRSGGLDGEAIQDHWLWKEHHAESERFPQEESIGDALRRYSQGLLRHP